MRTRVIRTAARAHKPVKTCVATLLLAVFVTSAVGCASTKGFSSANDLEAHITKSGVSRLVLPHAVDSEMTEWATLNVPLLGSDSHRLGVLAERLLAKDGLGITYSRDNTGTAREVFDGREANCLAFTNLFVGLARHLGIPVHFLEVRDIESFVREDDLIVHSDHIAVGFGPKHQMTIIDFAAEPGLKYRRITTLSDSEAAALYYSNRGTELLREADIDGAYRWLVDAVRIAPNLSAAWVNLGVAQRRLGQTEEAEASYRQALVINPAEFSAYQNLAALLQLLGRGAEALELLRLGDSSSNRNPYAFLALGDLSRSNGRWEEAERFYRRALRVMRDNAEPLAAMGSVALHSGDVRAAERWLRRARKIDPSDDRVEILVEAIEQRRQSDSKRG